MITLHLKEHYAKIKNVLIGVLLLNWAVALAKIIYGLISRCVSMKADGFHSLADGAANIIGIVGIIAACQPTDADHPYGHKKYETLAALGIAALLFIVAFNLLREGIMRIITPIAPSIDTASFVIMITTMCINFAVMRYEHKQGKALKSDILIADSLHTRSDILTSLSVIITLVAIRMGLPLFDPIATLLISLFIVYAGIGIVKQSSSVLCDSAVIVDVNKISSLVLGVKGVKACHKIRTRGRPDDIYIDLHVQVHGHMHVDEAHKISYQIEEEIKRNIAGVTDVVVHIEPKD